jgi:transcriptional regulator
MYPHKHFTVGKAVVGNTRLSNSVIENTSAEEVKSGMTIDKQLIKLIGSNPLATLIIAPALPSKRKAYLKNSIDTDISQDSTPYSTQEHNVHISHIPCHFLQTEQNNDKTKTLIAHVSNHHPLAKRVKVNRESNSGNENSAQRVNATTKKHSTSVSISLVFHGDQGYISPNDIVEEDRPLHKVPTWNYSKVHVIANANEIYKPDEKYQLMKQSTDYFERTSDNPWVLTDVPEAAIKQMLKAITFIEISITHIEGSFKLSQNKPKQVVEQIAQKSVLKGNVALAGQVLSQKILAQ